MNTENQQRWEIWGVGVVVSIAVLLGLVFKGVSGETVADAVKDIGAALIPILAAFLAARIVTGQMDPADRIQQAGEEALRTLQKNHSDLLSGPKANRENYDPENPGKGGRYLFIQRKGQGKKAQLIPVLPLREGIVEIRVPRTTLLVLGAEREGLEQLQQETLAKVRAAVEELLRRDWTNTYEIMEHKHQDIAIAVDFEESDLGPKKFGKAVAACGEAAIKVLAQSSK